MAYIVAGAMTDSSERWTQSMDTVTAGETAIDSGSRLSGAWSSLDDERWRGSIPR